MVEYYTQRASKSGLIISEATPVSIRGFGYAGAPGIYSDSQVAGWRRVTDAVHAKGGRIFLQLWHVGRQSHTELQPNGEAPVAPSAICCGRLCLYQTGRGPVLDAARARAGGDSTTRVGDRSGCIDASSARCHSSGVRFAARLAPRPSSAMASHPI
jgi:hypothetical protein